MMLFENISSGAIILDGNIFKWRNFEKEKILLCVRWYLRKSFRLKKIDRNDGATKPMLDFMRLIDTLS